MKTSVIITTLNRPNEVLRLVDQILTLSSDFVDEVIVVNAGEHILDLDKKSGIRQIVSSRKNQPYQRLIGAQYANTDWITFFDDDLYIIDSRIFEILKEGLNFPGAVGSGVGMVNEASEFDYGLEGKMIVNKANSICGRNEKKSTIGGAFPTGLKRGWNLNVECLSGGNGLTLRRECYLKTIGINNIIALAELGKAKGEDKYITRAITVFGQLNYFNEPMIQHPKPTYIQTTYKFNYKLWRYEIARARFLLADLYAKMHNRNRLIFGLKAFHCSFLDLIRLFIDHRDTKTKIKRLVLFLPAVFYAIRWTYIFKD